MSLRADVEQLISDTVAHVPPEAQSELREVGARLDDTLRVAIAGRVKAGKSTLLNAMVGEDVAPTDATECTRVVTWYSNGPGYHVWLHPLDGGERRQIPSLDLEPEAIDQISRLEVEFPSAALRSVTVIDTPGMQSVSEEVSARTEQFLLGANDTTAADVIVYLVRHLHDTDIDFLEAFTGADPSSSPTMAVCVLSRADEIGGCRLDSLDLAQEVAQSYQDHPKLRGRVQTVVPIAGLLALTSSTLRQGEYVLLQRLVGAPIAVLEDALVSVDLFLDAAPPLGLSRTEAEGLLSRFGVFGIRLSIALIRHDRVNSAPALARELMQRSGLARLRDLLEHVYRDRRDVLKAAVALRVIERHVAQMPSSRLSRGLESRIKQIRLDAHEIRELDALTILRIEPPKEFSASLAAEAERILGGRGLSVEARLGTGPDSDADRLRTTISTKTDQWRSIENRLTGKRPAFELAGAVVRSLEQSFERLQN